MKDTSPADKPRVFKVMPGGMWWADGWHTEGHYVFDVFPTYTEALDQAHEYAAMNRAAAALRNLGVTA